MTWREHVRWPRKGTEAVEGPLGQAYAFALCDNYLRFYLKYVAPRRGAIEQGLFDDADFEDIVAWDTLLGPQFENLVLNNLPSVLQALELPAGRIQSASPFFQPATKRRRGCQIDLLIQARRTLYVCEIRFSQHVDSDVIDEVADKVDRFQAPRGYTIRPVLLYAGRLAPSVSRDGFFDACVDLADLFSP